MSTIIEACNCTEWTGGDVLRRCDSHHRYHRGNKELTSITKVIKSTWPIKPDFAAADPAVLENARERGVALDALFSSYVNGTLKVIPAGTRVDVVELFQKLIKFWDRLGLQAKSQVILSDDELAGTCDVYAPDAIFDLKATSQIESIYPIQVGMYGLLDGNPSTLGIIHITKRFHEPRLIELNARTAINDASTVRAMWSLVQRSLK